MERQPSAQEGTHEYVIMAVVRLNLVCVCVYLCLTDCEQDDFPKNPATYLYEYVCICTFPHLSVRRSVFVGEEKIELILAEGNPYI